MKNKYVHPDILIIDCIEKDIILTSSVDPDYGSDGDDNYGNDIW